MGGDEEEVKKLGTYEKAEKIDMISENEDEITELLEEVEDSEGNVEELAAGSDYKVDYAPDKRCTEALFSELHKDKPLCKKKHFKKYGFDGHKCVMFMKGCYEGNGNEFGSMEECKKVCPG